MPRFVVCLCDLRFGKFAPIKSAFQSCQSNPKEPINLQAVKNRSTTSFFLATFKTRKI